VLIRDVPKYHSAWWRHCGSKVLTSRVNQQVIWWVAGWVGCCKGCYNQSLWTSTSTEEHDQRTVVAYREHNYNCKVANSCPWRKLLMTDRSDNIVSYINFNYHIGDTSSWCPLYCTDTVSGKSRIQEVAELVYFPFSFPVELNLPAGTQLWKNKRWQRVAPQHSAFLWPLDTVLVLIYIHYIVLVCINSS